MDRSSRLSSAFATRLARALCSVLLMGSLSGVDALSTAVARFSHGALAGRTTQSVELYVQYFIGDGEAVIRSDIAFPADGLRVANPQSQQGSARLSSGRIEIDYADRPLTGAVVDTLMVEVEPLEGASSLMVEIDIFTSVDDAVAHRSEAVVAVEPPSRTAWSIVPPQLYQGESARLELRIRHEDEHARSLRDVQWTWPEGIRPAQANGLTWAGRPDASGEWVQQVDVNVDGLIEGELQIGARARIGEMPAVALKDVVLRVDPLPVPDIDAEILEVGQEQVVAFRWRNTTERAMAIDALQLEVNSAFSDVALVEGAENALLEIRDGQRYVTIEGLGNIESGAYVQLDLRIKPQRPGPFAWQSLVLPGGRDEFIPLSGGMMVTVAWPEGRDEAERRTSPTDLELVSESFLAALDEQMGALPLDRERPIYLESDAKNDANWIVEDALGAMLRQRGHRLLVRAPEEDEQAATIRYRLVSSRVIYSPGGGWPLFGRTNVREAYGDLVLRLVDQSDGTVAWERRIRSYARDSVPTSSADMLGGDAVKRATIEADNKVVERSLSASIIGGLVYIFFIL